MSRKRTDPLALDPQIAGVDHALPKIETTPSYAYVPADAAAAAAAASGVPMGSLSAGLTSHGASGEPGASHGAVESGSSNTSSNGGRVGKRRVRLGWTEEETRHLMEGCKRHGVGNWKKILTDPTLQFNCRTAVDLKDRFRTSFPDEYSRLYPNARTHKVKRAGQGADRSGLIKVNRKERRAFSPEEDQRLLQGFMRHGPAWSKIQRDQSLGLGERRSTDLRDRFRNAFPDKYTAAGYKGRSKSASQPVTSPAVVPPSAAAAAAAAAQASRGGQAGMPSGSSASRVGSSGVVQDGLDDDVHSQAHNQMAHGYLPMQHPMVQPMQQMYGPQGVYFTFQQPQVPGQSQQPQYQGQMQNQMTGQMQGQYQNQYQQLQGQMPNQMPNQMQNQMPGQMQNQMPNQLQGQLQGQLQNQLHGQVQGQPLLGQYGVGGMGQQFGMGQMQFGQLNPQMSMYRQGPQQQQSPDSTSQQ